MCKDRMLWGPLCAVRIIVIHAIVHNNLGRAWEATYNGAIFLPIDQLSGLMGQVDNLKRCFRHESWPKKNAMLAPCWGWIIIIRINTRCFDILFLMTFFRYVRNGKHGYWMRFLDWNHLDLGKYCWSLLDGGASVNWSRRWRVVEYNMNKATE